MPSLRAPKPPSSRLLATPPSGVQTGSEGADLVTPALEFHLPGKIDSYHRRGDYKLTPHLNSVKLSYLSPVLLRIHSSFPKIIYSPPRGLHFLSLFLIKKVFKSEF